MNKSIIQNLALAFATILVLFILLEIIVNIFVSAPVFDKELNDIWYVGIPHKKGVFKTSEFEAHYRFNSIGFRDYEYSLEKDKNTCRIAVLGDSFAESLQVELNESWPKLLEKKLNSNSKNIKFEVMNFGLSCAWTEAEYFVMERYALKFRPDIVFLLFYTRNDVNNDFFEPTRRHFKLNEKGELIVIEPSTDFYAKLKNFLRKSKLVRIAYDKFYTTFRYKLQPENQIGFYGVFLKEYPQEWNRAWNVSKLVLKQMDNLVKDNNATLIIAIANTKQQASPELWDKILNEYPILAERKWNLTKPNKIMEDFCKQNRIKCIDTLDLFKKSFEDGENLYFEIDDHWTKQGHIALSDYFYKELNKDLQKICSK